MNRYLLFVVLWGVWLPSFAQETGDAVRIQDVVTEDVYAAGGTVDVMATVEGDVVVAGGRVTVRDRISGDVMAAGGVVNVSADIGDDVRLAGGDVMLSGTVVDDAIMAGGNITLSPDVKVGGRAWISGGRIDVSGTIDRELKATGGEIFISGTVNGNVELTGGDITIKDNAIIKGNLTYRSQHEANIADSAQIHGSINYEPVEYSIMPIIAAIFSAAIVIFLSLIITAGAWYLMFPQFIATAMTIARAEPWKCLGLGLAIFAATPLLVNLLFATVIGWLPALIISAIYILLLICGFITAVFYTVDIILGHRSAGDISRVKRILSFSIALFVLMLLCLVPLVGPLIIMVLTLLGMGIVNLNMYREYLHST